MRAEAVKCWNAGLPNSVKKRKIRAITTFKVIQGHLGRTNRKPVCDFLLVISSNWHPISYRFRVIAAYCSNFGPCVFEPASFFRFVTMHAFDRRTDRRTAFLSLYRVCIPCSSVNWKPFSLR